MDWSGYARLGAQGSALGSVARAGVTGGRGGRRARAASSAPPRVQRVKRLLIMLRLLCMLRWTAHGLERMRGSGRIVQRAGQRGARRRHRGGDGGEGACTASSALPRLQCVQRMLCICAGRHTDWSGCAGLGGLCSALGSVARAERHGEDRRARAASSAPPRVQRAQCVPRILCGHFHGLQQVHVAGRAV